MERAPGAAGARSRFRLVSWRILPETLDMPNDEIRIEELELMGRIGVLDEERAQPQPLTVSVILQPRGGFRGLQDDLGRTVDYAAVCAELEAFVSGRTDKLLETLADAMADQLLRRFELTRVELEIRKFVLPQTRYVAVRVARQV
jgi:dihydroneopterin aldolase